MKVNEVIVQEGFWDSVKKGADAVKGAAQGYKAGGIKGAVQGASAQVARGEGARATAKKETELATRMMTDWSAYAAKLTPDKLDDPTKYKAEVDAWLKRRNRQPDFEVIGASLPTSSTQDLMKYFARAEMQRQSAPAPTAPVKQKEPEAEEPVEQLTVQDEKGNTWSKTDKGWVKEGTKYALPADSKGAKYLDAKLEKTMGPDTEPASPSKPESSAADQPITIGAGKTKEVIQPDDPRYKSMKAAIDKQSSKPATPQEPASPKPTLNIPDGATPREAEEYKKRFQNDLNVWNKYNNPDYAEPEQVVPNYDAQTGVASPEQMAKNKAAARKVAPNGFDSETGKPNPTAGYGSGWNTNQPGAMPQTKPATAQNWTSKDVDWKAGKNQQLAKQPQQQAPMANVQANKPAQNQFANVRAKRPGEPPTAESAGGVPWKVRK